jgi:hypothetical protein
LIERSSVGRAILQISVLPDA